MPGVRSRRARTSEVTECGSCAALIRWVRYPSGKKAPLDAKPTSRGNVLVDGSYWPDGVPRARVLTQEELDQARGEVQLSLLESNVTTLGLPHAAQLEGHLFVPHFATCPHADRWKRKRRPRR